MSAISLDDVKKLATLSSLTLDDEQLEAMRAELQQILGYVEHLNEVDTEDIAPSYQVTGLQNVMREDIVAKDILDKDALLKNTPQTENGQIKVPRVLG